MSCVSGEFLITFLMGSSEQRSFTSLLPLEGDHNTCLMLSLIKELVELSALKDPTKEQTVRKIEAMRQLRSKGFKHREIWLLSGRKGAESAVRRQIGGVDVMDETEHDQLLSTLADFVKEYTLDDIEAVKKSHLKADDIRKNINLNVELLQLGLTPENQAKILEVAKKYGDPVNVLEALNQLKSAQKIVEDIKKLMGQRATQLNEIRDGEAQLDKQMLEAERYKTHMTIVKQLVADYSFDYDSLKELMSVAKKYGNPLQVIGAVNAYGNIEELKKEVVSQTSAVNAKKRELEVVEGKIRTAEAEYNKLMKLNAEANQVLGEIEANCKQSIRLQTISNLLLRPTEISSTPDELARITVALLNGVAECAKANPNLPDSFMRVIKADVEAAIASLQYYMRGH